MNASIDMQVLELVCARLCHELVGPVAALNNGVELLGEDDPDFVKDAIALLGQSARKAGQRLQFYRFAYGSSGNGAVIADCRELSRGLLEGGKVLCDWPDAAMALPVAWQKLACNMLVLAADALPRGGTVAVARPPGDDHGVVVAAAGVSVNFPEETRAALAAGAAVEALNSRTVQAYLTASLARRLGATLTPTLDPAKLVFTAVAAG